MTPITDAMVDAALDAWFAPGDWREEPGRVFWRKDMRAALEAAMAVAPGVRNDN